MPVVELADLPPLVVNVRLFGLDLGEKTIGIALSHGCSAVGQKQHQAETAAMNGAVEGAVERTFDVG